MRLCDKTGVYDEARDSVDDRIRAAGGRHQTAVTGCEHLRPIFRIDELNHFDCSSIDTARSPSPSVNSLMSIRFPRLSDSG